MLNRVSLPVSTYPLEQTSSTASLVQLLLARRDELIHHPSDLTDNSPFRISYLYVPANEKKIQWAIKRLADIVLTLSGLLVIALPLSLLALAIKLDSPGPIFFKQRRVGQHGQEFDMYKFRSMHIDAEARLAELIDQNETNEGMFKLKNDPRVTRVGRIIRKFSLDEFPQLINVLKGDMSLVGPRPPICRELSAYEAWHYVRFSTRPGLTGEWQVSGRSNIQRFDDVVALDFRYIESWSLLRDIGILLKTIPVVLFAKDAA
jgi:lipopolysaccharide/colanic/teichoic acid biosynthesis glycosyltransferase